MAKKYFYNRISFKKISCLLLLTGLVYIVACSFKSSAVASTRNDTDSLLSKKAFLSVYDVFMSPRCVNCHPSGDVPLVGEDSKLHSSGVKRGKEGKGMFAAKCTNCHTDENQTGLHMPPGSPNWRMPPANMKMVFQGKTAKELAAHLLDTAFNGNKTREQLIEHISGDPLVLAGWNPGEGRKTPPLSHEEFVKQFQLWMHNGAYLPD